MMATAASIMAMEAATSVEDRAATPSGEVDLWPSPDGMARIHQFRRSVRSGQSTGRSSGKRRYDAEAHILRPGPTT
jgi:hypothetical protein